MQNNDQKKNNNIKNQEKNIENCFLKTLGEIGVELVRLNKKNKLFISYAWEEEGTDIYKYQRKHVDELAQFLTLSGIERVIYDGDSRSSTLTDLLKDVEQNCDFIILIGTPSLYRKLNDDEQHVIKEEVKIISQKLQQDPEKWKTRIIPILLTGSRNESLPSGEIFDDLVYIDFTSVFESRTSSSSSQDYYDCFFDLLIRLNASTNDLSRIFISNKKESFRKEVRELLVDNKKEPLFNFPPSFSPYRRPKEKFDSFENGTREWLVTRIINLVQNDHAKAVFLLSEAGMGKSTLFGYIAMKFCQTMANEYSVTKDESLDVVALHFFNYYEFEDKLIETALKSISFQLCETVPGFADRLARNRQELEDNIKRLNNNVKALFNLLILAPAHKLTEEGKAPLKKCVILLDALDESEDAVQLTKTLHECFVNSPDWLVLIASSRPEIGLKQKLKGNDKIVELKPSQEENQEDLRVFIQKRMSKYLVQLDESMVNELVKKSGGVFLWLSFQEKDIKDKIGKDGILNSTSLRNIIETLPSGIEESYEVYFQRLYDRIKIIYPGQEVDAIYNLVIDIALILPRAPIPESIWKNCLGFTDSLEDAQRYGQLKDAASCLLVFSNDHLRAPHKSMIDWLCDRANKKTAFGMGLFHLAVDKTSRVENHLKLVKIFQTIYSNVDSKLTYEFPVHRPLTAEEQFAFTHVLYHCCESGELIEVKKWLFDFKHLFWLVYQAVKNNDYLRFSQDMMQVEETLDSNLNFMSNLVRLSQYALEKDPRQLISQIVGRMTSKNADKDELLKSCVEWLMKKPDDLSCYIPVRCDFSGLDACDTTLKAIFEGHTDWVNSICLSKDAKTLYTCSRDQTARSWNVETGQHMKVFEGHTDEVKSIRLSKDDKTLFTCSDDGTARSWNVETGQQIQVFKGHTSDVKSICLSKNCKLLFTCSDDKTARSWNVETGQQIQVFKGHTDWVKSICLSKDDKTLFTCSNDETARSWNVETGQQIQVFKGHTSDVKSICLSKNCKLLFTCSDDKTARSWNVETGQQIQVFKGHTDWVKSICLSKDDKTLFTCSDDKTARSWNVETGKQIQVFEGHTQSVKSICLSKDDKTLFTCSTDKTARSWNVETGQEINIFEGHTSSVKSICLSKDDKILFTCSFEAARSWNVPLEVLAEKTRRKTKKEEEEDAHVVVESICSSKDGKILYTMDDGGAVLSWNVETGERIQTRITFEKGSSYYSSPQLVLSDDGETLFCYDDDTVQSWNTKTGKIFNISIEHSIIRICVSKDNKTLFTCSDDGTAARSWNVETGQQINVFEGHTSSVNSICLSNDDKTLFTCSGDETVRSWNVETGEQIKVFEGHTEYVNSICLSNDDKTLFTCSFDKTARSWNVETGKQIHVFEGNSSIYEIYLSKDDKFLCAFTGKEDNKYWNISTGQEVESSFFSTDEAVIVKNIPSHFNIIGSGIKTERSDNLFKQQQILFGCDNNNKLIWWRIWDPSLSFQSLVLDRFSENETTTTNSQQPPTTTNSQVPTTTNSLLPTTNSQVTTTTNSQLPITINSQATATKSRPFTLVNKFKGLFRKFGKG